MTTRADLIETMARAAYESEPMITHEFDADGRPTGAICWMTWEIVVRKWPEIAESYRKAAEKSVEAIGAGGWAIVPREAKADAGRGGVFSSMLAKAYNSFVSTADLAPAPKPETEA